MPIRLAVLCLLVLVTAAPAFAHEVVMNDGTKYEGKILRNDEKNVVIETTFDGMKTLEKADVKSVNDRVPPLREQLKYRAKTAEDHAARWDLYAWAKKKGFKDELGYILEAIVDLKPGDRKARKLLGHKKVDGRWMSPDEETRYLKEKFEAEQRAKGLVRYEGEWVTPEERDAREKGLLKDGDEWVTEEEWHKRRGEKLVNGKWIKVGFKEGTALTAKALRESRVKLAYHWSAHFDALAEIKPSLAKRVLASCEKAFGVMRTTLRPTSDDYPETVEERIKLVLLKKIPGFMRFSQWFDKTYKADSLVPGFVSAVQRQHSWWWVQDLRWTAAYQFPNTDKTFVSNVVHNAGLILLTRYKANYKFPSVWLREGFAYYLEMEALGYSQSFTLGKGGSAGAGMKGPTWADSGQWRASLKKLVSEGQDPPLRRVARMSIDQFGYQELVKSWSVVEFLVRKDAKKFKAFIDLSKDRSKTEEDALKAAFGWSYKRADTAWRAYVGANFQITP